MSTHEGAVVVALIDDRAGRAVFDFTKELVPGLGTKIALGVGRLADMNAGLVYVYRAISPDELSPEVIDAEVNRVCGVLEAGGAVVTVFGPADRVQEFRERYRELRSIQRASSSISSLEQDSQ